MDLTPFHGVIILKPTKEDLASGNIKVAGDPKKNARCGIAVAVGGSYTVDGVEVQPSVAVKDFVFYPEWAEGHINYKGQPYVFVREKEIFGYIERGKRAKKREILDD